VNAVRGAFGIVSGAIALIVLARASALPVGWHAADASEIRLSWTARPERVERCRAVPAEELAKVPAHMRQRVICEGNFASYALEVSVDGETVTRAIVRGGGLRNDRPLHLFESVRVKPGTRRVRVEFARRESVDSAAAAVSQDSAVSEPDTGLYAGRARREAAEREQRGRAAIAPRLVLDTVVTVAPASVLLITYDPISRALRVRGGASSPRSDIR